MILVVLNHIETYSLVNDPSVIGLIFMTFRMPLFFFISGLIAYNATKIYSFGSYVTSCFKKIKVQLIPTLFFGIMYTYLIANSNISTFFSEPFKLGYWFTLTLLLMFIIYYTIAFLFSQFQNFKDKGQGMFAMLLLLVMGVVLVFEKTFFHIFPNYELVYNILSLNQLASYLPFFLFGIIAGSYKKRFEEISNNKYVMALTIVLFTVITTIRILLLQQPEEVISQYNLYIKLAMGVNGILGITIVYNFFKNHQESFTQQTLLGKTLQYIGRRTLDIYLLHYFLLPDLKWMGDYMGSSSTVVGLFVCLAVAIIVVIVCLVISNTIRLSPILAHYLFGVKKK